MKETNRAGLVRTNSLLKEKLLQWMPVPGRYPTAIEGLMISRRHDATGLENCVYRPLVAVVIQGYKRSMIGSEEYRYGENHCLIIGVDIPSANHVIVASPEQPFLTVSLDLDKYLITQLSAEIPPTSRLGNDAYKGMAVAEVDPEVLDAFLRLV
ncbi:MAG TPA: AraC family transcriptional regulator, partial [Nitrospirota bacterium]|nr:AraC family transcriptional regulator [Nitrospirota bacterium]